MKNKQGYVSIEAVISAGLLFALGAWAFSAFSDAGVLIIDGAKTSALKMLEVTIK